MITVGANVYQTAGRMGGTEGQDGKITVDSFLRSIEEISELGYDQAEIIFDPLLVAFTEEELESLTKKLIEVKEEENISYSVHLPFWWINIASPEEKTRRASVSVMNSCIELTEKLQPKQYVLHVFQNISKRVRNSLATEKVKQRALDILYESASKSIQKILGELDKPSMLCIENLLKSNLDRITSLVEEFNTSITYDLGHKFMADREVIGFLKKYSQRISSLHAHNIHMTHVDESSPRIWKMNDHLSIARKNGPLDYEKIISTLREINFDGSFVVEVKRHEDAASSAEYLKQSGLL